MDALTEIVLSDGTKAETKINIPPQYLNLIEDVRYLIADQCNPNVMTKEQHEAVWRSLQKFGWVYPIITNKDGILGDGEQRVTVCLNHKEYYAPVLRIPLEDVDRRILRQVLNKLKGEHNKQLDTEEFLKIIEAGKEEELKSILLLSDDKLKGYLEPDPPLTFNDSFEVVVECQNEAHQKEVYEKLTNEGYTCRVLTL